MNLQWFMKLRHMFVSVSILSKIPSICQQSDIIMHMFFILHPELNEESEILQVKF
jgi:hypothetical protein